MKSIILPAIEPALRFIVNRDNWRDHPEITYINPKKVKVTRLPDGRYEVLFLATSKKKIISHKQMQAKADLEQCLLHVWDKLATHGFVNKKTNKLHAPPKSKPPKVKDLRRIIYAILSHESV